MSCGVDVKKYPQVETLGWPVPRVAMPRAPRMQVPGGTNLVDLFYLATSPITRTGSGCESEGAGKPGRRVSAIGCGLMRERKGWRGPLVSNSY